MKQNKRDHEKEVKNWPEFRNNPPITDSLPCTEKIETTTNNIPDHMEHVG